MRLSKVLSLSLRYEEACGIWLTASKIIDHVDDHSTLAAIIRANKQLNRIARPKLYTALHVRFDMTKSYRDSSRPRQFVAASELTELSKGPLSTFVKYVDCHSSCALNAMPSIMDAFPKAVEELWSEESKRWGSNLCYIHHTHQALKFIDVGSLWPEDLTLANLRNLEFAMIRSFPVAGVSSCKGGALVMTDLQLWSCYFKTCPRPLKGFGVVLGHPDYPAQEGPDIYWLASYQRDDGSYVPLLDVFAKGLPTQKKPIWDEPVWGRTGLRLSISGDLKIPEWGMPELYENPWDNFSCDMGSPHWMIFATDDRTWTGELQKLPLPAIWPCSALSMRNVDIDAADVCYIICRARDNLVTLKFENVNLRHGSWAEIFECALTWSNNLCNVRICESSYIGASDGKIDTGLSDLISNEDDHVSSLSDVGRDVNWPLKGSYEGINHFYARKEDADGLRRLKDKVDATRESEHQEFMSYNYIKLPPHISVRHIERQMSTTQDVYTLQAYLKMTKADPRWPPMVDI